MKEVTVLGTPYEVRLGDRKEIDLCEENDGECRQYQHILKIHHSLEGVTCEEERDNRTQEIVAHEVFHAFVAESGLDVDDDTEEKFAVWYMKMWRKLNNAILEVLDENGLLD